MQPEYDYKKFAILYVDDEEKSLKSFARAFGEDFRVLTASSAQEGLKLLEAHKDEIGVLMTDQRMPGEKGVWLIEKARQLDPHIIRILATAYADMDAVVGAVNTGAIYRYVNKPWEPPELEQTLKRGLEFFLIERERDQLLHEKMSVLQDTMVAERLVSLGLLAAGLSHHIRNSLVAVKTFLDLTPAKLREEKVDLDDLRNPEFWNEYYQSVQLQIEKINNLLSELWSASENQPLQFSDRLRLHEVVDDAIKGLRAHFEAKLIQVENHVPAALPEFNADKQRITRLFELLLRDELASLPADSRITITAELDESGARPEINVRVNDNGPGLPREGVRVLFDPFVVRSDTPAEYGIRLMACFFIVYHHGGKIEATSREGEGTTFRIRLPLDPKRAVLDTKQGWLQKSLLNGTALGKMISPT